MSTPWLAAEAMSPAAFAQVRRRAIFECCKWDPQIEDVGALSAAPLIIERQTWDELSSMAEALFEEMLACERELVGRADLHGRLGLPRRIRRALSRATHGESGPAELRFARFDFHFTTKGWMISEVNSDVPGGFVEASGFSTLMAEHYPHSRLPADPVAALVDAITRKTPAGGCVALVHATAYADDHQVMAHLERRLKVRGFATHLLAPDHLRWRDGTAHVSCAWTDGPVDLIVRFFPGEWLSELPRRSGWREYFHRGRTILANPATALLTQSKRFPLVWNELDVRMPIWQKLLPETRDPREVKWAGDDQWVVKPALGRIGEGVGLPNITTAVEWKPIMRDIRRRPSEWIAQRRFEMVPMRLGDRIVYPSLGVFVVDGRAAGMYGRVAERPLIDWKAQEAAVLVADAGVKKVSNPGIHHATTGTF